MNASRTSLHRSTQLYFGFTLRDAVLCSMPVIAMGVSILTLL